MSARALTLGSLRSQGRQVDAPPRSRDIICPSFANSFAPKNRGRREDRVHAAPAVSCAKMHIENAHEHTGSAEAIRPSLRNGFTAYFVLSPVNGLSCHRHLAENSTRLDASVAASGPHDFAVRFSRARQSQLSRPSLPDPRFVTIAHTPLVWDGMARNKRVICPRDQARPLRHIGTTGKSEKMLSRFI
jgi:hypothetical protein